MNKLLPILLVVVLSGCGKSPYEKCLDDLTNDSTNYKPMMDKMTKIQKDRLRTELAQKYYKFKKFCKDLHSSNSFEDFKSK